MNFSSSSFRLGLNRWRNLPCGSRYSETGFLASRLFAIEALGPLSLHTGRPLTRSTSYSGKMQVWVARRAMLTVSLVSYLQPLVQGMTAWRNLGPTVSKAFLHLSSTSWGQAGLIVAAQGV